jgi:formylglycine-generating enzyme required for sulfatase activity
VVAELYAESPDGGTHGAAFCTLTRWGRPIPSDALSLQPTNRPPADRHWYVNSVGMTMIKAPAGQFKMGDDRSNYDDERPRHAVTLTQPFWASDREVTVELFRRFVRDADYPGDRPEDWEDAFEQYQRHSPMRDCPVHSVSWEDAVQFCNWLTWKEWGQERQPSYRRSGKRTWDWKRDPESRGYRLPTEAEWEYVCRAESEADYCYGGGRNLLAEYCVYFANSYLRTWPSGGKLPNGWGVFDMHGNVWEWCDDWYGEYLAAAAPDPGGPFGGHHRVLRGGSWLLGEYFVRCALRYKHGPSYRSDHVGFRVVASAPSD